MYIWLNILVSSIAVLILAYIYPGAHVDSYLTAILVAIILSSVSGVIGPILKFFNFPPDVLNLWLISVVINVLMVLLVARYIPGFTLKGYGVVFIFSAILSLIGASFSLEPKKRALRFK